MKIAIKRSISLILAALLVLSGLFFYDGKTKVSADHISFNKTSYGTANTADYGYVYTPDVEGTLPAVIFCHGLGGPKPDSYMDYVERWVNAGYLSPMILIMPEITHVGFDAYAVQSDVEWLGKVINRMDKGSFDTETTKVDKVSGYTISGYSMGGAAAMLGGARYSGKFVNVGGFSPAIFLHNPPNTDWINQYSCCNNGKYTNRADRHLVISSGNSGDEAQHFETVERSFTDFAKAAGFAKIEFDHGGHEMKLFAEEFFCFLYYTQHDAMPSQEVINAAMGSEAINIKKIVMPSGEVFEIEDPSGDTTPVINSISSSLRADYVKMGEKYTISVQATGENLKYQWEWHKEGESWANSQSDGNNTATISLEGKREIVYYRCKVSSGSKSTMSDEIVIRLYATEDDIDYGTETGIVQSKANGYWIFVRDGKYDKTYKGLAQATNGIWYYVSNGKIDRTFTGQIAPATNGRMYYVSKGKPTKSFDQKIAYCPSDGKYYYCSNGRVDRSFSGKIAHCTDGNWYYVKKGMIDKSYTGIAEATNGKLYYVKNGMLDRSFSGTVKYNGKNCKVVKGVVK